jgi:hypothetical protein
VGLGSCSAALSDKGKFSFAPPSIPSCKNVEAGDVIGVGWVPADSVIFFTMNGALLEMYAHSLPPKQDVAVLLSPIVAASNGFVVTANFGQSEFAFKVMCVLPCACV